MEDFLLFFGRAFQKEIFRFVPHSSRDFTQILTGDMSWDASTRPQEKGDSQQLRLGITSCCLQQ